uniref:SFRICE_036748 n=1 Tax=Spodoptera frugiperda TaxID=7108 RepID=A0A2H1WKA3_SPOFR
MYVILMWKMNNGADGSSTSLGVFTHGRLVAKWSRLGGRGLSLLLQLCHNGRSLSSARGMELYNLHSSVTLELLSRLVVAVGGAQMIWGLPLVSGESTFGRQPAYCQHGEAKMRPKMEHRDLERDPFDLRLLSIKLDETYMGEISGETYMGEP